MIRLEYMTEEDLPLIIKWNDNTTKEYLMQWAGPLYEHPLTLEQLITYFSRGVNQQDSDTHVYKIMETEYKRCLGTLELGKIDIVNKTGKSGVF